MPELPEVQTIVSDLRKILPGLKIAGVETDWKKMFKNCSFENFKRAVFGEKILDVRRTGKNILIDLTGNKTILVHQKMTGHFLYGKWELVTPPVAGEARWLGKEAGAIRDDPQNRFIHLVFDLSNKKQLALSDMRKFAKVLVLPTSKLAETADLNLGIDPFDKYFTLANFKKIIRSKKSGKIKTVLMDQSLVSGIGNIYSDEILWLAGIHPVKDIKNLGDKEIDLIYKAILLILKRAITARGTSSSDYRDPFGHKGEYQEMRYAYRLTGNLCQKKDGGIIARLKVGGRSAHFCPVHQK